MRTHFLFFLYTLAFLATAWGGEVVPTFNEAKKKAATTKSDFVVCAYGKEWDLYGTQFKKQLWDKPATFALLDPSTLITTVNILELPTKEQEEANKKESGEFKESIKSLPHIFLFDKDGFCYASLYGKDLAKNTDKLASQLKALQIKRKKRDELINRSNQASSPKEKGKLLGQAGEIPGLNRPKSYIKELEKIDPDDKSGYQKRFKFSIFDYHKYIEASTEEATKAFDEVLQSPAYTTKQKQQILAIKATHQRKKKEPKSVIAETYRKLQSLDPHSFEAKAAANASKAFAK